MSSVTDTCPGCGRSFAPGGYLNHLRFSRNPQCGSLQNGLVYQYPTALVNAPPGSPLAPRPTTPNIEMLDVSNEELPSHSDVFPSASHEDIYMSINEHDDYSDNEDGMHNTGNTTDSDGDGDDEGSIAGDEGGGNYIDQPPETVFCPLSRSATATDDSDTDSEDSDEEEELQQEPVPLPPNSGNPRRSGSPSAQLSGYPNLTIDPFPTNSKAQDPTEGDPVTVKFGGRAGEAVPVRPEHIGYTGYSHTLGTNDDVVNEWAPFSTRTEWELARWAKLRGPSSTALSELLRIDGVSQRLSLYPMCSNPFPGR